MVVRFLSLTCFLLFLHSLPVSATEMKNHSDPTIHSPSQKQVIDVANISEELLGQLTTEEQRWYHKFQNGLLFFSGWKEISEEILTCLPEEKRAETKNLLEYMGIRIGTEWSKANDERKIDTEQLRSWGSRLRKARKNGAPHLSETVRKITIEVDSILKPKSAEVASDSP